MNYIYRDINAQQYSQSQDFEDKRPPRVEVVDDGIILPSISGGGLPWGMGGIVDSSGEFLDSSRLDDSFGGAYAFDDAAVPYLDETVIYLGILPRHWGHMLIDVLSKLWYSVEEPHRYRIAYFGLDWVDEGGVNGVYKQLLSLAGIDDSDLLFLTRPTRFRKILVPSRTMGFERSWNNKYLKVIEQIISNAEQEASRRGLPSVSRLYLTRQNFAVAKKREIGEEQIVSLFRNNGFDIVSPERLDVVEQVHLYHSCQEYVCLSGTLAHNAVFARPDVQLTILNRTWALNPPQVRINQLKGFDATYVDVYDKRELKHHSGYRAGDDSVHVLSVNDNLIAWCKDYGLACDYARTPMLMKDAKYAWLTLSQPLRKLKRRLWVKL